jgi:hypothetical protein
MRRSALILIVLGALSCATAALASTKLSGTFQAKFGGHTYRVHFGRHHSYSASVDGVVHATGKGTLKGSDFTFHDKTGPCVGTPGKYKYSLKGKTLKFTVISDPCFARAIVLAHTFKKLS